MEIKGIKEKLDAISSGKKSNWDNEARNRLVNKSWLKHSRQIAIKINVFIKKNNIKQKDLANLLNVSPQQVSKIIKGKENLTLETISKIENVLKIKLFEFNKPNKSELNIKEFTTYKKTNCTKDYKTLLRTRIISPSDNKFSKIKFYEA